MQKSKVGLDFEKVEYARGIARKIADDVQDFVGKYTTVAVERTLCRLLGIDGIDSNDVPLPNVVVDELKSRGVLSQGVMYFMGNAVIERGSPRSRLPNRFRQASSTSPSCPHTPWPTYRKPLNPPSTPP